MISTELDGTVCANGGLLAIPPPEFSQIGVYLRPVMVYCVHIYKK